MKLLGPTFPMEARQVRYMMQSRSKNGSAMSKTHNADRCKIQTQHSGFLHIKKTHEESQ